MRVAVVGGTGFIGRRVVATLSERGFEPVTLSRRTGFGPKRLEGAGAVVNLAGIKRERGRQTFEAVHVTLVRELAAAMKDAGVRRLVHVSVVVARPDPRLPYHDTKHRGEVAVRESGLDWTILRPSVVYGEGDDLLTNLVPLLRPGVFPLVGRGRAPMSPVDVDDVARAVVAALRPEAIGRTFDVVGPDRIGYADVVRTVSEAAKLPALLVPTPVALLRLGASAMERVLPNPPATSAQVAMLEEGLAGDPEPARRALELSTAPFTAPRIRTLVPAFARETPGGAILVPLLAAAVVAWTFRAARHPWIAMTVAMTALLIAALAVPSVRKRARPRPRAVLAGLAAALPLWLATFAVSRILGALWPGFAERARVLLAWTAGLPKWFLLPTLAVIVAAEEAIWRGIATRLAMERLGRWTGVAVGAGIYALAHVATGNPLVILAAAGAGLVWSWLYAATDDLVAPFVCHLTWDVLILFVVPVA
jgi:NADH dehydrogenase